MKLLLLFLLLIVNHCFLCDAQTNTINYIKNDFILKIKPSYIISKQSLKNNLSSILTIPNNIKITPLNLPQNKKQKNDATPYFHITIETPSKNRLMQLNYLKKMPFIEWIQPNYTYAIQTTPSDTYYQSHQWALDKINTTPLWPYLSSQCNTIAAIIDTGIDIDHEDLTKNIWTNTNEIPNNQIDDDNNGYIDDINGWDTYNNHADPHDDNGHGTHVAGILGAQSDNATGIASLGSGCKLIALKAASKSGQLTSKSVAEAILYAINNQANIINLSFGATKNSVPEEKLLEDIIQLAIENNIIIVSAAGNQSLDIQLHDYIPASYPGVIAVSATTHLDTIADYSNYGEEITISAPGGSHFTIQEGIFSTIPPNNFDEQYQTNIGTSMAAPHVSSLILQLLNTFPTESTQTIINAIKTQADDITPLNNQNYGHGRINAFNTFYELDQKEPTYSSLKIDSINDTITFSLTITDNFKSEIYPQASLIYQTHPESDWMSQPFTKNNNHYTTQITETQLSSYEINITDIKYTITIQATENTTIDIINKTPQLALLGPDGNSPNPLIGPNPFNPHVSEASIQYHLTTAARIEIYIHQHHGELVWYQEYTDTDTEGQPGTHTIKWNGRWNNQTALPSGPYTIYIIAKTDTNITRKIIKALLLT